MSYSMPVKKVSMQPFIADFQKVKSPKVTFESLPKFRHSNVLNKDSRHYQQDGFSSRDKQIPSFRPFAKSLNNYNFENESGTEYLRMSKLNTHLDLHLDDADNDLNYTPYEYNDPDDDYYDQRPQTSYLNVPFASRNRALESIAECRTPTPSSSSSRGGDVTPEFRYNQMLDVRQEKFKQDSEEDVQNAATWVSKLTTLPKIRDDKLITPVKVKPLPLGLRPNERLPSIDTANHRLETAETFLVHSRFVSGHSRADSVESIRTPSTSRHLLWSRGSIMSDGGFPKIRSDTNMTKHSFQSEPTPVISESPDKGRSAKKKRRKHRRKAATKVYVPFQSFIQSVNGKENDKSKTFIKSANFTLYFPSIHKKCVISPVLKDVKSNVKDKFKRQSST